MYLYATDYDGTVTYHGVTPELKEALARWKAEGNLFGVVSGRPYNSIRRDSVVQEKLPVDFVIANNGALIADGNDNMLSVTEFDTGALKRLLDRVGAEKHGYFRMDAVRFYRDWFSMPEILFEDGHFSVDGTVWPEVTEITVDYPDYRSSLTAAEEIERELGAYVRALLPGETSIDCIPASASKAKAVRRVTELLGVKPERIFTTGDSHNDLDMLLCPEFEGYAVNNAMKTVREAVGRTVADPLALLNGIFDGTI